MAAEVAVWWYIWDMTIRELESEIQKLGPEELEEFRKWFEEFDSNEWDDQLEEDVNAGKLNHLAEQALKDLEDGKCTEL